MCIYMAYKMIQSQKGSFKENQIIQIINSFSSTTDPLGKRVYRLRNGTRVKLPGSKHSPLKILAV